MTDSTKPTDPSNRPPVERLSDIAWARIEREMWTRLDGEAQPARRAEPSRRRWVWLAAPLVAAAAIALIVVIARPEATGELSESAISRVVAGASPSTISFNAAHITLDAETAIVLDHARAKPTTVVERGGAWFNVTPRAGRPPFIVVAGDAIIRVVGTRFKVARSDERITVAVEHGTVQVTFRGDEASVGANQEWSSEHPTAVTAIATSFQGSATTATATTTPDQLSASARPEATPDQPHGSASRSTAATPEPSHGSASRTEATATDAARFRQLNALESRDSAGAITGYLELAKRGPFAEVALASAARLAADRHDPRAKALLLEYLRRFPHGTNAKDVRLSLQGLKGDSP